MGWDHRASVCARWPIYSWMRSTGVPDKKSLWRHTDVGEVSKGENSTYLSIRREIARRATVSSSKRLARVVEWLLFRCQAPITSVKWLRPRQMRCQNISTSVSNSNLTWCQTIGLKLHFSASHTHYIHSCVSVGVHSRCPIALVSSGFGFGVNALFERTDGKD